LTVGNLDSAEFLFGGMKIPLFPYGNLENAELLRNPAEPDWQEKIQRCIEMLWKLTGISDNIVGKNKFKASYYACMHAFQVLYHYKVLEFFVY